MDTNEPIYYYVSYVMLVVVSLFSVLISGLILFEILKLYFGKSKKGSYAYYLTYLLQSLVMLAVQIFLFRLLLSESLPPFIVLVLSIPVGLIDMLMTRYHNKKWGVWV